MHPEFLEHITDSRTGDPNYNLAVPVFCVRALPHGVIGLIMISLFAAAMSSLDSTINSLSATTMRDVVERFFVRGKLSDRAELVWSRVTTIFWGVACIAFSFFVGGISKSIVESINMIGSLANGPILATFLLATLTRRANDKGVVVGIVAGFAGNLLTWKFLPNVSWLWWNVSGCGMTFAVGYLCSFVLGGRGIVPERVATMVYRADARKQFGYRRNWRIYQLILLLYFFLILAALAFMLR